MYLSSANAVSYPDRLATYQGYWDEHDATARQLSAIGHVYDRPPLEALEEGSRCISCSAFVKREHSTRALEGFVEEAHSKNDGHQLFQDFNFHHPGCERLQVRIPIESRAALSGLHGGLNMSDLRRRFEQNGNGGMDIQSPGSHVGHRTTSISAEQRASLFSLPVELRLQIYSLILPSLPNITSIVPLHRESARVMTSTAAHKTGPRDLTQSNILATCKLVHREALGFLFDHRTYRFSETHERVTTASKTLYLFLRHIGQRGRSMLRSVDVVIGGREDAIAFSLLGNCPNLKHITIRHGRPNIMFPHAPIWYVDGIAALLELRGLKEVEFGDCRTPSRSLESSDTDAIILKNEITKLRGEPGEVRWVGGRWLNL